ncbi:unnamed protein product [Rotaria socialis]|uniref:Uncharacterized protein n=1 Tax=Rotaria socialis TaxID=392032 RepID=A0A818PBW2_9BILA|nr:unnamed protein product [Rotaria socialis]CAF4713006.1 unnamed protein product [Rotaria socialis]
MHKFLLLSSFVITLSTFNIHLTSGQIDSLPSRPITVNGQTVCHIDSDCNGSCGLNPGCYWTCGDSVCMYQNRPTWEPLSNREAGIPDLPINN